MSKVIEKKILPEYFEAVLHAKKNFELRKDDSDYEVGDWILLKEWDGREYTGRDLECKILYILRNVPEYGLKKGYCILSIRVDKIQLDYKDGRQPL